MPAEAFPGVRALQEQTRIEETEMGVLRPDGEVAWLSVTAAPLGSDRVLITYGDVSESHRSRAILSARARLTAVALEVSLEQLLRATLDEAEALTGSCIGFYHFMEEDQVNLHLQAWSTRTEAVFCKAEGKGAHYPVAQAGVWADCVRERRPLIHNDYANLPNKKGLPPGHATVLRELTVPVLRGGRVVAILGIGNKATDYVDVDVDSVQRLADLAWDLADSKRTKELLLARERSFQAVIQNSPLAMLIAEGPEESVTFLNRKFEELFGYGADEIRSVADWWPRAYPDPAYRSQVQSEWAQHGQKVDPEEKHRQPQHVTVTCKDGLRRFIRIEFANLGAAHVITFTDLTENRQTEEVLGFLATCGGLPGEDFFQSLARFLADKLEADFVCIDQLEGDGLNARTLAVWCDGNFEDNTVYALKDTPCGEVVGKAVCCFPASVTRLFPRDQVLQDLCAESYVGVTLWGHTGKPIGLIAVIRRCPLGNPAQAEAVLRLVAGRAAGELERVHTETLLRESEERYRTQFDRASEGIFSISLEGDLMEVNQAFARMHGYTREEMLTMNLRDLDTPDSLQQSPERMKQLLAGETLTFEVEHVHKDGHSFPMEVSASLVPSGGTPFILSFHRDITERNQADAERHRLQLQLQQAQKMESLGSLAGGVAHDMNNVLGAILGLASANLETQREGSSTYRALDTISKAAVRGGKMVQSLLRFARQSRMEEQDLDLNTLLREEVRLLERTTLSQVQLAMDLAPDLLPVRGDASALTHAIMNLCVNAVDAMPASGTLTLRTRNIATEWVEVLVEDTGIGMPKEILDKAMDPFFTTKGVGKGTGLGLSIVYSTVKAHRGQVELWSEPGQGTRVTLRFPACASASESTLIEATGNPAAAAEPLSVLVVDDDELIQSSMQSVLEVLGHGSVAASSGEEALLLLEAGLEPDLVILDMNMPGLGGMGTLPLLRALLPTVPVLLATGRADQSAQALVDAHPGVTLVPKPFSLKELQSMLGSLAQGSKAGPS